MSDLINERRHTRDWLSSGKIKVIITVSEREMLKTFGDRSCRMGVMCWHFLFEVISFALGL